MTIPKRSVSFLPVLLIFFIRSSFAQVDIQGTVYDRTQQFPLRGVSVLSKSGAGTATDSLGHYTIHLSSSDSIYFSYLGKATGKIAVGDIPYPPEFDMSLEISVDSLPSVLVWPRDYHYDSLLNRREYQKVFDYSGGSYLTNMKSSKSGKGMGLGFDMDVLLHPGASRREEAFQKRLEEEEQDNYVDHRFSRALVKRITKLDAPALDSFMRWYRPSYDFIRSFQTDWEFYEYIQKASKSFMDYWKQEHPE
jgi:hypothetical protein